ncbi:helix-turn-helix domain-containing protein, partial [Streptomyces sp. GC420]|uniref:winged helix-turn-helix transcriptional regulator n=1 Tax=Streptomyces sp. GC420 TaxID=2697568 RepID=UPI001FB62D22
MPRRSYDQYCAAARALDSVGDRWTLLIVRELLAGPRRYTDLHADLPGVSTDVLASRLKDMERDALATRRKLPPPAAHPDPPAQRLPHDPGPRPGRTRPAGTGRAGLTRRARLIR